MKKKKISFMILVMFCMVFVGVFSFSDTAYAKKITSFAQVKKMALKKVKNAIVTEMDKDYEKGILVYEVHLLKGTKEYELTYRASDGKMLSYGWEQKKIDRRSKKKVMSESKCKKLARKEVPGGKITSIRKTRDDGIIKYKVKMQKDNKKYELEYHARTCKLLEYEWELKVKTNNSNKYIGVAKAKKIALKEVPGGTVVKVEFDKDDGVPIYEVEIIKDYYEYDIEIHAKTGKILDIDIDGVEYIYD